MGGFIAMCLVAGFVSAALVFLMVLHNLAIDEQRRERRARMTPKERRAQVIKDLSPYGNDGVLNPGRRKV